MAEGNPVYLRLGYNEALESKREVLSSEILLLNMIKTIKRYNALKEEEFGLKVQLYKLVKELGMSVRKTKATFPFVKVPEKIKEKEAGEKRIVAKEKLDEDLETQLRKIQERLKSIGR
jgi:Fe2+ transport system protein B